MLNYRTATQSDALRIAQLHTKSWQENYRGAFSDEFLDGELIENRKIVWEDRLKNPAPNQHVILAETENELCGFACIFIDDNPDFGTLLDNLHVASASKEQGIGTQLIKKVAQLTIQHSSSQKLYLGALEQNIAARKFYESLGGIHYDTHLEEHPGGSFANACMYVWEDAGLLIRE